MTNPITPWEFDETEETSEDEASNPIQYEIMNYPADTTLSGYCELWDRNQLEVPDFQRAFIWDQVKASKLVESFLLGLPVPGVFLFKSHGSPSYLIIDGQQRIRSVISYIKGRIHDRVFKLKNVNPKWDGLSFDELPDDDQFKLKGAVLRSTIIQQINPDDGSSIYLIFERLNTGGVNLNPMEIRQCVSYGPFINALKEMNSSEAWKALLGRSKADSRLRDVELVLRCVSLAWYSDHYEKPMKGFLNTSAELQRKNPDDYEKIVEHFEKVCKATLDALGEKPFHLRGRLNYGMLDAIIASEFKTGPSKNLKSIVEKLKNDPVFMEAVTANTSDTKEVKLRLAKVKALQP